MWLKISSLYLFVKLLQVFHPRSCVFFWSNCTKFSQDQPTNQPNQPTNPFKKQPRFAGEVWLANRTWGYEAEVLLFPVRPNHQETYAWRGSSSFFVESFKQSTPARFMVLYTCFSFGQKVCLLLALICIGCWILLVCVNNSRLTTKTPRYGADVEVF